MIATRTDLDPDVALMLRARDGCDDAFSQLVARNWALVIRVVTRVSRQPEIAEDLAQEVFLRLHRARSRYRPTSRFTAWLNTIAYNVARNAIRARVARPEIPLSDLERRQNADDDAQSPPILARDSGPEPLQRLMLAEQLERTRTAMRRISGRQRQALTMFAEEEKTYSDIADELGTTPAAVRSLLARARSRLRTEMGAAACSEALEGSCA